MPKKKNPPTKISIGVPLWGRQDSEYWKPLALTTANLWRENIELIDIIDSKSMSVDNNRNNIVHDFLASRSEYLAWTDTDNDQSIAWIARLLEGRREVSGGIYFRRSFERPTPIAYMRQEDGRYQTIPGYTRGEIIRVDASGMNCMLMHRSVFDKIRGQHSVFLDENGRKMLVHNDRIEGAVSDTYIAEDDNLLVDGQLRLRLRRPPHNPDGPEVFPYFRTEFNRSEDFAFYEALALVGIPIKLDTSIECNHHSFKPVNGSHFREWMRYQKGQANE